MVAANLRRLSMSLDPQYHDDLWIKSPIPLSALSFHGEGSKLKVQSSQPISIMHQNDSLLSLPSWKQYSHTSPIQESPARALEQEFFNRFECCGKQLEDLHDLLAHYDVCHNVAGLGLHIKRPHTAPLPFNEKTSTLIPIEGQGFKSTPSYEDLFSIAFRAPRLFDEGVPNFAVPMEQICSKAIVDLSEPDMSDVESSLSDNSSGPKSSTSDYSSFMMKPKRKSPKSNLNRKQSTTSVDTIASHKSSEMGEEISKIRELVITALDEASPEEAIEKESKARPSKRRTAPSEPSTKEHKRTKSLDKTDSSGNDGETETNMSDVDIVTVDREVESVPRPSSASSIYSDMEESNLKKPRKPRQSTLSIVDPETGERKYKCAVPTCKKEYKNANGLKYHIRHTHPNGEGMPIEYLLHQQKKKDCNYRPYECTVAGCGKRYKNLNGLKYHIEHSHNSLLPPSQEDKPNIIPLSHHAFSFLNRTFSPTAYNHPLNPIHTLPSQ